MKIIVTGATGFIGAKFVELLTDLGVEVLALGRKNLNQLPNNKQIKLSKAN